MASCQLDTLPMAFSANAALSRFCQLAEIQGKNLTGAGLLYERAMMMGLIPAESSNPGGGCRLLRCRDAVLAINLPRQADWEQIPAWLGPWLDITALPAGDWNTLANHCQTLIAEDALQQAHLLGLAVSRADQLPPAPAHLAQIQNFPQSKAVTAHTDHSAPLVVDLSSLWAGPLCGHLLQQAGCRVIKVEGLNRLDGAREGHADFYHLLNQGKESLLLDFRSESDIKHLKQLIARADIVIEAARPRALRNLGIDAEHSAQTTQGQVWLSITGHGRQPGKEQQIGFGDDTAAAAGLCHIMHEATGKYAFAGDAIADPLTGIHAALLAWQSYLAGGNELIALSLCGTVSWCLHQELQNSRETVLESCRQWLKLGHHLPELFSEGPRKPVGSCASPGEHNHLIFAELDSVAGPFHQ